jgi:hypothetical protein
MCVRLLYPIMVRVLGWLALLGRRTKTKIVYDLPRDWGRGMLA